MDLSAPKASEDTVIRQTLFTNRKRKCCIEAAGLFTAWQLPYLDNSWSVGSLWLAKAGFLWCLVLVTKIGPYVRPPVGMPGQARICYISTNNTEATLDQTYVNVAFPLFLISLSILRDQFYLGHWSRSLLLLHGFIWFQYELHKSRCLVIWIIS